MVGRAHPTRVLDEDFNPENSRDMLDSINEG
jgi:hypothetical protein